MTIKPKALFRVVTIIVRLNYLLTMKVSSRVNPYSLVFDLFPKLFN